MSRARFAVLVALVVAALVTSALRPSRRSGATVACAAGSHECKLVFVEQTNAAFRGLARVVFRVNYAPTDFDFGDPVACAAHELQQGITATFQNDAQLGVLQATLSRANGLFPYPLVVCEPLGVEGVQAESIQTTVVESHDAGGQDLHPAAVVGLETFDCTTTLPVSTTTVLGSTTTSTVGEPTTTTTTTVPTTSSTTTTTLPVPGELCGDADGSGTVTASDALLALRTAVGASECPESRCDTNADGSINTTDSLRILRKAVGLGGTLTCAV